MSGIGFELMTPVFKHERIVRVLDSSATAIELKIV
jgi:hypothetical protein